MQTKDKKLYLTGQNIYAGLDVHNKDFKATLLGERVSHKTFTQSPEAEVLTNYLNFPGVDYHASYEAGYPGFWAQEQLTSLGVN